MYCLFLCLSAERSGPELYLHASLSTLKSIYVCECCACIYVYMYVYRVPGTHRGQRRKSDHLGLQFGLVMSYHVGNRTWALCNNDKHFFDHQVISLLLLFFTFYFEIEFCKTVHCAVCLELTWYPRQPRTGNPARYLSVPLDWTSLFFKMKMALSSLVFMTTSELQYSSLKCSVQTGMCR